jgi:hypothetical protein
MGDIVNSEEFESQSKLHAIFNDVVARCNARHAETIESPLTITLGDEFQGIVRSLSAALAIVSNIRIGLLTSGIECRFVIGTIVLETEINRETAWNMMGSGLSKARDKLNIKTDENAYRFSFPEKPIYELLLDEIGVAVTTTERSWTPTQLRYVALERQKGEQTNIDVAKKAGTSARNLYKVLRAANYRSYSHQVNAMERALDMIDHENLS